MASITCSPDSLVVTSGSRVKVLPFSDPSTCIEYELKAEPVKKDSQERKKGGQMRDTKKAEEDKAPGIDPHVPTGRILAATFSPSGAYFVASTDQKDLALWSTQPKWTKKWTKSVTKRCMALTFGLAETALFVADKAGDVYQFDVQDDSKEGAVILGHVSMLLDVAVSADDKFILTAERDEKIRVSHLPNAYNIHTFCLGHTEFVNRLAVLPDTDVLLSTAGDTTIRLWDYRKGTELCHVSYLCDQPSSESTNKHDATVTCLSCSKQHNLVAMAILDQCSVLVFHVAEKEGRWAIEEVARIQCKHPPWSVTFDPKGQLFVLVPDPDKSLLVYRVLQGEDQVFQIVEDLSTEGGTAILAQQVQKDWEFLKCSCDVPSPFRGLHKVPFDNMPDYLRRKQERMDSVQSKKGRRRNVWRQKGKKRSSPDDAEDGEDAKRTLLDDNEEGDEEEERDVEEEQEKENGKTEASMEVQ